jgi:hypothetical protein
METDENYVGMKIKFKSLDYLGLRLDRRFIWHKHVFTKCKQVGMTLTKMYSLLGHKSKLSISNKLHLCKAMVKPVWTYGIQLWGVAATSSIEILERFQSKALCVTVNASWFVSNMVI